MSKTVTKVRPSATTTRAPRAKKDKVAPIPATRPDLADEFDPFANENPPISSPIEDELAQLRARIAGLQRELEDRQVLPEPCDPTDRDEDQVPTGLVLPTQEEINAYLTDTDKHGNQCLHMVDGYGTERVAYASHTQDIQRFLGDYRPVMSQTFKLQHLSLFHKDGPQFHEGDERQFALVIFVKKSDFKKSCILCMQDCGPLLAGYMYYMA